jgi:hypothetical protein
LKLKTPGVEMVYDPNRDTRPAELFQCHMRGWKHGAGGSAMDSKFTGHADEEFAAEYNAGYLAGYELRKKTQIETAERLGYTPSVLRIQGAG